MSDAIQVLTAPLGPARPVQGGGGSCLEPIAVTSRPYLCTGVDVSPPPPSAHGLTLWPSSLDLAPGRRAPCGRCPRDLLVSAPCCGDGIMREPGCRVRFHVLVKHSHPCLDRSWRLVTRDKEVCKANSATRPGRGGGGSVHVQRGSCREVRRSRWFRSSERTSVSNAEYSWAISKDQTGPLLIT